MSKELILASESQARAHLLQAAGYRFRQMPSGIAEPVPLRNVALSAHLIRLARWKAAAVAARHPDAYVLGADTALVMARRLIGKPRTLGEAADILTALAGQTHEIKTAVCVIAPAGRAGLNRGLLTGLDTAHVTLRAWSIGRIRRHVAATQPLAWAGAYAVQEKGSAVIVSRIEGDPSTVIGLPIDLVDDLLQRLGYS